MTDFPPTAEQLHIHELFGTGETVKVRAGAGTGKTTTLLQLADILEQQRRIGLYVAFNKSIATEAGRKFGKHITASTAHSLAYNGVRATTHAPLLGKMRSLGRVPFSATSDALNVRGATIEGANGNRYLSPFQIVRHALRTVEEFCKTPDLEFGAQHVREIIGLTDHHKLVDIVLPYARAAWADALNPNGTAVEFGHSHYLKLWALGRPRIGPDGAALFLDEAQDTSPVLAGVIADQTHLQRVYVGDSAQAIYGFTGAIDAMRALTAGQEGRLTQSWRFGQEVADAANVMLSRLHDDMTIVGNPSLDSRVDRSATAPDAILTRTNGRAITQVMAALRAGRKVHLQSDTRYAERFCDSADKLQNGGRATLEDLTAFDTWFQVQEHAENSPGASDWKVLVDLIDKYGTASLRHAMSSVVSEARAEVIVSTAHKAKGREWSRVQLEDDLTDAIENAEPEDEPDELMLAYVAITRAQHVLNPGRLLDPPRPKDDPFGLPLDWTDRVA